MDMDHRGKLRRLAALSALWQAVADAEKQSGPVRWRAMGGLEAIDFLHALEKRGEPHPLLAHWMELRATVNANRPGPNLQEQRIRPITMA